jgi:P-type Ca2+ transporter type 2C
MSSIALALFSWMLSSGWTEESARNVIFLLIVLFQNVHVGNSRSETKSLLRMSPISNPFLFFGVIAALLIHVAAMYIPFMQVILGTEPLPLEMWILLLVLAFFLFPIMELHKWLWRQRYPGRR